jgi:nucleotide-binding universal stress UspA family protein
MKRVLIAIDYNPCAQKVAETGYAYAKAMNAEIYIVHVIADIAHYEMEYAPIMGFEGFSADCSFKSIKEQKKEADNFLAAVIQHLNDTTIKTRALDGKTAETILAFADECKADLIVIGPQSHNSFEKILLGDVASKVVKHSKIPVLIVPTDKQDLAKIIRLHDTLQYI